MDRPKLYIGIETTVRELDAKLLLACVAAESGYEVWLGRQKMFLQRLEEMPQGILLNKSISPRKATKYAHYRKLGFPLVAYDEEGLAPFSADEYQKRRIAVDSLKQLEYFFAWGDWQRNVIGQKAPGELKKVIPVGHPRVDLTRREVRGFYRDEVDRLRERYGTFVLINTNFSFYNHFQGRDFEAFLKVKTRAGKVADDDQRQYYWRVHEHKKTLFYAFADMVVKLRERFPEATVILRPHPSEDHEYWRQTLPQDEKIQVVHEGTVLPWILASEVMIHNSCTTGIEGYLLEQPVIAYRPVQEDDLEFFLTNAVSDQVFDSDTLLQKVEQFLTHEASADATTALNEKRKVVDQYIVGIDGPLSCERIVEYLKQIQFPKQHTFSSILYQQYVRLKKAKVAIYKGLIQRNSSESRQEAERKKYTKQKFRGLPAEDVRQLIGKFQQATQRFSHVQVTPLEKDLLKITCEN